MIKSTLEKIASEIGFGIGTSDDITQSNLLNGFCEGLNNSIRNSQDLNNQMCYIVKNLSEKSKFIIKELCEFIKLDEEK